MENASFGTNLYATKNDQFTKTGSGQTQGQRWHKREIGFSQQDCAPGYRDHDALTLAYRTVRARTKKSLLSFSLLFSSTVFFCPEPVLTTDRASSRGFDLLCVCVCVCVCSPVAPAPRVKSGTKPRLFAPFNAKIVHLPRQARDKHRENSNKRRVFL